MKVNLPEIEEPDLDVAPLIDMVFLLLVYFMVTASLVKSEGDLGIRLPGRVEQTEALEMNDEQIIEITNTGRVRLNGSKYGTVGEAALPELVATLTRYKASCDSMNSEALITINADGGSRHQRLIDVMDACAAAGIENVTFAGTGGD